MKKSKACISLFTTTVLLWGNGFFFNILAGELNDSEKKTNSTNTIQMDKNKNLVSYYYKNFISLSTVTPPVLVSPAPKVYKKYNYTPDIWRQLSLTAALQFQHLIETTEDSLSANNFYIRRGRMKLDGKLITQNLEFEIEFDVGTPDPDESQFDLKDFYFDYRLAPAFHIKFGQYKVPFGFQELTSSKKQQFVERSLASETFTPGRDIGIMFWGPDEEEFFEYYLGIFNGDGDNTPNANTDLMYTARFVLSPFGKYKENESDLTGTTQFRITLGGEALHNKDVSTNNRLLLLGGFGGIKFLGLSLRGEYFEQINRDKESSSNAGIQEARGYFGQLGVFLLPKKIEAALRASETTYDLSESETKKEQEYSAVLNYFFKEQNAKLQIGYTLMDNEEKVQQIRTQFQLYF